jgi:hypothetical protein
MRTIVTYFSNANGPRNAHEFWRLIIFERCESGSLRRKREMLFLSGCGIGGQLGIRPMQGREWHQELKSTNWFITT